MVPGLVQATVYSAMAAPGHAAAKPPRRARRPGKHGQPPAASQIQENKTQPSRLPRAPPVIKRLMAVGISSKLAGNDGQQKQGDEIPLPIQQNDVGEKP
jgi:hypothetical protein